jgi:two-component system, NarL family, sensor kinase
MKTKLAILLYLIYASIVLGQTKPIDSLIARLALEGDDTTAVKICLEISEIYEKSQPLVAMEYTRKAKGISEKIHYPQGLIKSLRSIAYIHIIQGNYDSTLLYYQKTLVLSKSEGDSLNIGISLFNIGSAYRYLSDYKMAVDYSLQAIIILEKYGDKSRLAQANNGLQLLYYYLPNYDKAVEYGKKAVQQATELNNPEILLMSLSNLSMSYKDLKQLDTSKILLMQALKIARKSDDVYAEAAILINLAGVSFEEEDFLLMRKYAQESLILHQKINSKDGECESLRGIAISYLHTKQYELAKKYAIMAYTIADSNNYKKETASCLKTLSNISFAMQNLSEGEMYYNKSDDLFEEIFKESYVQSAAMYEKKYESEKRIAKIELQQIQLNQKKLFNLILLGGLFWISLISFLVYRNLKHRQKIQQHRIQELETEKQLMATSAVLKGEDQERTRLAKDLHDGLGGMLSGIKYSFTTMKENLIMTPSNQQDFERSMDMLDSSIKEMRRVAHNMMPETLVRFGLDTALKDFCNDISQSGALTVNYQSIGLEGTVIEQTTSITLYRIVQELLNNTMKHAKASSAIVQLNKSNDILSVTVEDNGRGFDTGILKAAKGIGWVNIKNRIDFLKGTLDITSREGEGTSVQLEMNI